MARVSFFDAVLQKGTDNKVSVVAGATVKVFSSGTAVLAILYENDGITTKTNPVVTDGNGNYRFRVEEGAYDFRIEYTDFDETTNNIIVGSSPQANLTLGTGILSGGTPSVNIDGLSVDISSGDGKVVDNFSAPPNVTITDVSWNAFIGVIPAFLGSAVASIIGIDKNGLIVQTDTFPRGADMRNTIWIGSAVHADGVNVTEFNTFGVAPITQVSKSFDDLGFAIGVINIEGNRCIGSAANGLKLFKSSGEVHFPGIDWTTDKANPNFKLVPSLDEPTFVYTWRNGSGAFNLSLDADIIPGLYDDDTVSTTAPNGTVSNNQWTILRIQYTPDQNIIVVHYGQVLYSSSSNALEALSNGTDSFTINPAVTAVPFINFLIVKGNATNLNNISDALFIAADKFGGTGGQSSSSPSTVTKQSAYNNSADPELETNDLRGADSWKRGTIGGDTDDVLEVLNGASTQTFSVKGDGDVALNVLNATGQLNTTNHVQVTEVSAPSTPATGKIAVYAKSDKKLYIKDDAGTETDLTGGGGGDPLKLLQASAKVDNLSGFTIRASLNMTSISDAGVGKITCNFDTNFANTNYTAGGCAGGGANGQLIIAFSAAESINAGSCLMTTIVGSNGAFQDCDHMTVNFWGEQ